MDKKKVKTILLDHPFLIPPGDHIRDWLEGVGMGAKEFASRMGTSTQTVDKLLKGEQALTPDMAGRLERVTGVPASFWSNLEADYQNELARRGSFDEEVAKEWIRTFPIKDLVKRGALSQGFRKMPVKDQREELLKFFGVGDEKAYDDSFSGKEFAARTLKGVESSMPSLTAWIQLGLKEAGQETLPPYDAEGFASLVDGVAARTLPLESENQSVSEWLLDLKNGCRETGVHLLFLRSLEGMRRVNGVTTWLLDRPVVILPLYGGRIDRILFSFLHEAGHVAKHRKTLTYVAGGLRSPEEEEADRFAARKLLPATCNRAIEETGGCPKQLAALAADYGIYSGLVIGRYCFLNGFDRRSAYLSGAIRSLSWEKDQWKLA